VGHLAAAFGRKQYLDAKGSYRHHSWTEQTYRWPAERGRFLGEVAQLLAEADGDPQRALVDVYVCPYLRRGDRRVKGDALAPLALHADLDGPPADADLHERLDALRTASGSDGHEHDSVPLAEPVSDLDRWSQLVRALRDRLGGGADSKIADNDLLRLPGTINCKPAFPARGQAAEAPSRVSVLPGWGGRLWALDELAALLGVDLSVPAPAGRPGTRQAAVPPRTVEVPAVLPARVQAAADEFAAAPDKSAQWAKLIGRAAAAELDRDQAFAVAVKFGLPHLPRYRGREVREFDKCWTESVAFAVQRRSGGLTLDHVREAAEGGLSAAEVRAELDDIDPHLWDQLGAAALFPDGGPPLAEDAFSDRPDIPVTAERVHTAPPAVLLDELLDDLGTWQVMPDATPLVAALAVAITAFEDDSDPAWLLLVADPSSGKTDLTRLFDQESKARLDQVTVGGLLTWSRGKLPVPTGLLTRVDRGLVTFGDLSSLLAGSDSGTRDEVFALLRRVADGEVNRDVAPPSGARVNKALQWRGRVHVIAAVTGVIDRYAAHNAALGDRWLNCRLDRLSREQGREAIKLSRVRDRKARRDRAAKRTTELVAAARAELTGDELSDELLSIIADAAQVTAWGRASVPRATTGRREIVDLPVIEQPMRLAQQLSVVARGVLALGLPEADAATVVRRLAADSMPLARRQVLTALSDPAARGALLSTSDVARRAGLHWNVTSRHLEELATVDGVVESVAAVGDELDGARVVVGEADETPDRRVPTRWRLDPELVDLFGGVVRGLTCVEVSHETGVPHT